MSRYYRVCPICGSHLDPGEVCDCLGVEMRRQIMGVTEDECAAVLEKHKKELPGATNTEQLKQTPQDH